MRLEQNFQIQFNMDTYEKKYKEALERARDYKNNIVHKELTVGESIMDYIFPELKESEDEQIRKEIIDVIQHTFSETSRGKKKWIAWLENIPYTIDHEKREGFHLGYKAALEKQGNSSIKWNKNTERNKPQVNHSVLMKTTHGIAEGEWKGEYWEQYRWAGIVRDSDVLSWMELSDLDKQGEQKPTLRERYKNIAESEWFKKTHEGMSVSDDEKVDNVNKVEPRQEELTEFERAIKQVMEEAIECGDTHNLKADADMLLRIAQKSAWSEEDKKEYKYVLKFVDNILNNCDNDKDYDHCKRCYDWLQSLKQRIGG